MAELLARRNLPSPALDRLQDVQVVLQIIQRAVIGKLLQQVLDGLLGIHGHNSMPARTAKQSAGDWPSSDRGLWKGLAGFLASEKLPVPVLAAGPATFLF